MSFLMNSDIETMINYVIINLFSETDVFFSEWLVKVYFSSYDYEQSDRRAAFQISAYIIYDSAYRYRNPDMFSGDICGCLGRIF